MPSSAESDDLDQKAHCHDRTSATEWRQPSPGEISKLPSCRFCFPDGEVHVDESNLLITPKTSSKKKLHRDSTTDGEQWVPDSNSNHELSRSLRSDEVTSVDELADALGGGE